MKKYVSALVFVFCFLLCSTDAKATYFPYNIGSLKTYLGGSYYSDPTVAEYYNYSLPGIYEVTPIAYGAGYDIWFYSDNSQLFYNKNIGIYGTSATADFSNAYFKDQTGYKSYLSDYPSGATGSGLEVWQLVDNFNVPGLSLVLNPGTFIIGFNDNYNDDNHDDFILAATPTPVPIPGAAWLLSFGLLGIWSFRKKTDSL